MKITCDTIRDLLPLYAEQVTSEASNALVEEHLKDCPRCRAELEQMQRPVPVKPESADSLKQVKKTLHRRQFGTALAVAAVLVCILLGLFVWYSYSPTVTFDEAGIVMEDADLSLTPNPLLLRTTGKNVRLTMEGAAPDMGRSVSFVLRAERFSPFYLWLNDLLDAHFSHVRHDTGYYPIGEEQEYCISCKDAYYYYVGGELVQVETRN